ncbi:GNAT family N-acetyltransferase [Burkholderia sp. 22PA0106]|uniref:GNAT family N-acetyltransferase n=1 Tax=Burkholderia sp. 22PA0106 TaxID=3237371 RepID=UPI0039C035C9
MNTAHPIKPYWVDNVNEADELAVFFTENTDASYISHSELQFGLAESPKCWNPDRPRLIRSEITESITAETAENGPPPTLIFAARNGLELVAMGCVAMHTQGPGVPYAVLEDIVISRSMRHVGIGRTVLDWLVQEAREAGCHRIFLESGAQNHKAHEFFEKQGFTRVRS